MPSIERLLTVIEDEVGIISLTDEGNPKRSADDGLDDERSRWDDWL